MFSTKEHRKFLITTKRQARSRLGGIELFEMKGLLFYNLAPMETLESTPPLKSILNPIPITNLHPILEQLPWFHSMKYDSYDSQVQPSASDTSPACRASCRSSWRFPRSSHRSNAWIFLYSSSRAASCRKRPSQRWKYIVRHVFPGRWPEQRRMGHQRTSNTPGWLALNIASVLVLNAVN